MGNSKEIKKKIDSILNTQKITKAMEMISIAKIKKIEESIKNNRFYTKQIEQTYDRIFAKKTFLNSIFLKKFKKINKIGLICISTNKGLCGSLNSNLFKFILKYIKKKSNKKKIFKLFLYGLKAKNFFSFNKKNIFFLKDSLNKNLKTKYIKKIFEIFLKKFLKKKFKKIYVAFNYFKNKFIFVPKIIQIFPVKINSIQRKNKFNGDYLYESDIDQMSKYFFKIYTYNKFYQYIMSNIACEHCARMISMKQASDSSKQIISELKISYNKVRQSSITQELNEIISGTSAVFSDF